MARRVFGRTDFTLIATWWAASFAGALMIAEDSLAMSVRLGAALAVWITALGVPAWIVSRHKRLDEMQQMILWRMVASAGLFIVSYLVAMAAYFTLTAGADSNTARGLLTMAAMAAPMAMMFAAAMTAFAERAAENGAEQA